jgi:hypothetical protein
MESKHKSADLTSAGNSIVDDRNDRTVAADARCQMHMGSDAIGTVPGCSGKRRRFADDFGELVPRDEQ